jgi:hypothetical protein
MPDNDLPPWELDDDDTELVTASAYDKRAMLDREEYPWRSTPRGFVGIPPTIDQYRQSVEQCPHCQAKDGKHCMHSAGLIRHTRYS